MPTDVQWPFEFIVTHLPALGWPAVIAGIIYAMRFLTKAETRLQDASLKFNEMHKVVTNHMVHGMDEAVTLLRKQDARWDSYLIAKSAQTSGHD